MIWKEGTQAFIVPQCGIQADGQKWVLGVVDGGPEGVVNGGLQLVKANKHDFVSHWGIMGDPDKFHILGWPINGFPGRSAVYAPYENSPAMLGSLFQLDEQQNPNYWWRAVPQGDGSFCAIQLCSNTKQNLNVAGTVTRPDGALIYSYKWSDGAPNEVWQFEWIDY